MFSRYMSLALAVASLTVLRAIAIVIPAPDIDGLIAGSNLVVLGELITVEPGVGRGTIKINDNPVKVRVDRGTLRVDETLLGTQSSSLTFEILVPEQNLGWSVPLKQDFGLFFFRTEADGKVAFSDAYYSYIPVPRGLHARGDTTSDRVVSILGDMLTLPNSRSVNLLALSFLSESKSTAANAALRAALGTARETEFQIRIANGLLLQGDASTLKFVKEIFLTGSRVSVESKHQEVLGNVMAYYLKDPAAIPDLEELLVSPSVFIRRGAAGALRRTRSPKAVNGLAKALEDADSEVRYWGVVGLAEVSGQDNWRPSEPAFKSDEDKFLSHWKEWARNRR